MRKGESKMVKESRYEVTIRGIRPILVHNGRLADPLDDYAKALKVVSKKRDKSDEDHIEVGRVEFVGGLYLDPKLGPVIPADNLQAVIERGATKRKLGKVFKALVEVPEPEGEATGYALKYDGPRDPKGLWANKQFVHRKGARISNKRVIRTRARFPTGWTVTFPVEVLHGGATKAQVEEAISDAGIYEGLGDWRPRYGKFEVVEIKAA